MIGVVLIKPDSFDLLRHGKVNFIRIIYSSFLISNWQVRGHLQQKMKLQKLIRFPICIVLGNQTVRRLHFEP